MSSEEGAFKVFISWSGQRSKQIAAALRTWIPDVFQNIDVWMSDDDIIAGARWGAELGNQLETTNFGILCLTPENVKAPWLLFEAGSLAKALTSSRVIPYRFGLAATDVEFPLAQFQGVDADLNGTMKMIVSLNNSRSIPMPPDRLKRVFEKWWPELENSFKLIAPSTTKPSSRTEKDLLTEILDLVRSQEKKPTVEKEQPYMVWQPMKTVHNVTAEDRRAMSLSELEHYLAQLNLRYQVTEHPGEENALEGRMRTVEQEILERKKSEGAS
jgi:hypothetical protein